MKKNIWHLFILTTISNLYSSFTYEELRRPPQEVSFLRQEIHRVYGTEGYADNAYRDPILGIPVTDQNHHLFNHQQTTDYSLEPRIVTGEEYLIPPSPRTSNNSSTRTTYVTPSPRTPTLREQNSEQQCQRVTIIFGATFITMLTAGIVYYAAKLTISHSS